MQCSKKGRKIITNEEDIHVDFQSDRWVSILIDDNIEHFRQIIVDHSHSAYEDITSETSLSHDE